MDDGVNARERAIGQRGVADVADDQLDRRREVGLRVPVDLGLEAVEHDDLVATGDQRSNQVRADESGAAGHENPHG